MKDILVSPPFGTYIADPRVTSVVGSYTLHERSGRFGKIAQFVWDNLRYPVPGGYRNRIGLRNPGVASLVCLFEDCIYSIVGLEPYDWESIFHVLMERRRFNNDRIHLELNVSCPNVHDYLITRAILERYTEEFIITVKLPPDLEKILPVVEMCGEAGVNYLHLSNTVPSLCGGLSGYPLKAISLPLVERFAREWKIIGGGGIYTLQDILDYRNAGATYFSTSTVWLNPFRARALIGGYYDGLVCPMGI